VLLRVQLLYLSQHFPLVFTFSDSLAFLLVQRLLFLQNLNSQEIRRADLALEVLQQAKVFSEHGLIKHGVVE
jgi:hypothetical protein